MPKLTVRGVVRQGSPVASFTLIELLVVMAIIAILAALVLAAGNTVMAKAARSRASSEIQAMSTALEGYKTDNGIYPQASNLTTNIYSTYDGSVSGGPYQASSQLLYQALSGQTNFNDAPSTSTKRYMSFKANQLGNINAAAGAAAGTGSTYVQDPWNFSYGYSTGTTNGASTPSYPYNGSGFFDLWSTGGLLVAKVNTNAWLSNWQ